MSLHACLHELQPADIPSNLPIRLAPGSSLCLKWPEPEHQFEPDRLEAALSRVFVGPGKVHVHGRLTVVVSREASETPKVCGPSLVTGVVRLAGRTVLDQGAEVARSSVTSSYVAGCVTDSDLVDRVVVADEVVPGDSPSRFRARLARVLVNPDACVRGAFRHGELSARQRDSIRAFYSDPRLGVPSILSVIEDERDRAVAWRRVGALMDHPVFDSITPEELYRFVFGLVRAQSSRHDPFADQKRRHAPAARDLALTLLRAALDASGDVDKLSRQLGRALRMSVWGNLFDSQSAASAAIERPGFLEDLEGELASAVDAEAGIDQTEAVLSLAFGARGVVPYFTDNYEEAYLDVVVWALLALIGHSVVAVGKARPARGDATSADLHEIVADLVLAEPQLARVLTKHLVITDGGSDTFGTMPERLERATLRDDGAFGNPPTDGVDLPSIMVAAPFLVLKGQANCYTLVARNRLLTQAPVALLFLAKGLTAARVVGLRPRPRGARPASVIAVLEHQDQPLRRTMGERLEGNLREVCASRVIREIEGVDLVEAQRLPQEAADAACRRYVRSVLRRLDARSLPMTRLAELYEREFVTDLLVPASGAGSRVSHLINKPIAVVDGVNTAVALTLHAASKGRIGNRAVAVEDGVLARLLAHGRTVESTPVGGIVPRRALDREACRRLIADPASLSIVRSVPDGNGGAYARSVRALARSGGLADVSIVVNADYPSLLLERYPNVVLMLRMAALSLYDPATGAYVPLRPTVVVASKSPMTPDAVVGKGSVLSTEVETPGGTLVVPTSVREWADMTDFERSEALERNRGSLESGTAQHHLNVTALALRSRRAAWYLERVVAPYLAVEDKGIRQTYLTHVVELAHESYLLESALLEAARQARRPLTDSDLVELRKEMLQRRCPGATFVPDWRELVEHYLSARSPAAKRGRTMHSEEHTALRTQLLQRVLLEGDAVRVLLARGWLRRSPHGLELTQAGADRDRAFVYPATRLIDLGSEAPSGIKDVARLEEFEESIVAQASLSLCERGVQASGARVRFALRGTAPSSFDFAADTGQVVAAIEPSSVELLGDVVLDPKTRLGDDVLLDGRSSPVAIGPGPLSHALRGKTESPAALEARGGGRRVVSLVRQRLREVVPDTDRWRLVMHPGCTLLLGMPDDLDPDSDADVAEQLARVFRTGAEGILDQVHLFGRVELGPEVVIHGLAVVLRNVRLMGRTVVECGAGLEGVVARDTLFAGVVPDPASYEMPDLARGDGWMGSVVPYRGEGGWRQSQ